MALAALLTPERAVDELPDGRQRIDLPPLHPLEQLAQDGVLGSSPLDPACGAAGRKRHNLSARSLPSPRFETPLRVPR